MRINKYIAANSGLSRRAADTAVANGRVYINGTRAELGSTVHDGDTVTLDGQALEAVTQMQTIMLHKPVGYVCSRAGQGSQTVYELLPAALHHLKPVGRLDKDSSGLLLLTNDGDLAQELTHPRNQKTKRYEVTLDVALQPLHQQMIHDYGVQLDDGPSKLSLTRLDDTRLHWQISMQEGRNRQIRRTFAALGYTVTALHRTQFGNYTLGNLPVGKYVSA